MSTDVEFGSKAEADSVREQYEEYLCSNDDRRLKTVTFASDLPEEELRILQGEAAESRADKQVGSGQVPLTDEERKQIDWSKDRANVLHARTIKAMAVDEGVDDWLSYYDPMLTTDEHRQVMREARESGGAVAGADVEETDEEIHARQHQQAKSSECDHAADHCKHGDPDACEFLQERCGFDEDEVETILGAEESEEMPGRVRGALSQLWTRYQIGIANAKEAAAAINEIHQQYGEDLTRFEELGDRALTLEDVDWQINS